MTPWPAVPLDPRPRRIILHWTGGTHRASHIDRAHYHYLIDGQGQVVAGVPVEANMRSLTGVPSEQYAAHTRAMNSWSVGVAFCGMVGARPGGPYGSAPLTEAQVLAGCRFVAELCYRWSLPVDVATVHTHAEADRVHGVRQAGKWDIDVLPWITEPHDGGEWLRARIREAYPITQ